MSTNDNWLREMAAKRKAKAAQAPLLKGAAPMAGQPVGELWQMLQRETVRQAGVFTDALGDPGALVVETTPDEIHVKTSDGRLLTVHLDRERAALSETLRTRAGGMRKSKSLVRFRIDSTGKLAFNFGGLQTVAGTLLRRMLD